MKCCKHVQAQTSFSYSYDSALISRAIEMHKELKQVVYV